MNHCHIAETGLSPNDGAIVLMTVVFALSTISPTAWAEIYTCEDANGIISFTVRQEKGCTPGLRGGASRKIYRCEDANGIISFTARQDNGCAADLHGGASRIYSYKDENGFTHFTSLLIGNRRYKLEYQVPDPWRVPETPRASASKNEWPESAQKNRLPAAPKAVDSASSVLESPQQPKGWPNKGSPNFPESNDIAPNSNLARSPGTVWATTGPNETASKETSYSSWLVTIGVLFGIALAVTYFSRLNRSSKGGHDLPNDEGLNGARIPPLRAKEKQIPSWHTTLGVAADASIEEIRRAFRQKMSEYHPDKVASLGEELKALAEEKSKEISLAYRFALRLHGIDR